MAQQVDPASTISPSNYAENHVPQFARGSVDPGTGNLTVPTQAQISQGQTAPLTPAVSRPSLPPAPPLPALSTTQFGEISADSPKPPSLGSTLATIGKGLADAFAPYAGAMIGGSIGSQIGGGASFGNAAFNTAQNIGNVLESGARPFDRADIGALPRPKVLWLRIG
jgi:hypothetical protein